MIVTKDGARPRGLRFALLVRAASIWCAAARQPIVGTPGVMCAYSQTRWELRLCLRGS
jgi:hypothetical protein